MLFSLCYTQLLRFIVSTLLARCIRKSKESRSLRNPIKVSPTLIRQAIWPWQWWWCEKKSIVEDLKKKLKKKLIKKFKIYLTFIYFLILSGKKLLFTDSTPWKLINWLNFIKFSMSTPPSLQQISFCLFSA